MQVDPEALEAFVVVDQGGDSLYAYWCPAISQLKVLAVQSQLVESGNAHGRHLLEHEVQRQLTSGFDAYF